VVMAAPSIEDWIAINDLFTRYACGLDHGDVETVVSCFTRDGVIESPAMGRFAGETAVREFAERNVRYQKKPGVQLRHVVSNVRIDVAPGGNRARALCYLLDFLTEDGKTELLSPGEYDCQLAKVDGNWKFEHRLVVMDKSFKIEGM
jgi:3-phenylpropionate/cinnamic acid dioxygenase small subunit